MAGLLALALALFVRAERASGEGGELVYDRGAVLVPAGVPQDLPIPLLITFFTDCVPGLAPPDCGPPAARWTASDIPVEFCTFQKNRPAFLTAEQFREAVTGGATTWNAQETAVGIRYTGDCISGTRWEFDNGRNEIGFDDERNVVRGDEVALARGSWVSTPFRVVERRDFFEFDIVLAGDTLRDVPFVCVQSTVVHELGHALGLGHSDVPTDLMFESFNPSDPSTCHTEPSVAERVRLQELYGVDRSPTADAGADRLVEAAAVVTLTGSGSDPEDGALSFQWAQLDGPTVELSGEASSVSFIATGEVGQTLVFGLTVFDPFLHAATDTVTVTVSEAVIAPRRVPPLESFTVGDSGHGVIGWGEVEGATGYEFCRQPPGVPSAETCSNFATPAIDVSWQLTLGSTGLPTAHRVFTTDARETTIRACNSQGCSRTATGPLSGGLRWPAWEVDYDYIALALDIRKTQWTILIVANVSGPPRTFTLYTGPPDDPTRQLLRECRRLAAGRRCVGFLRPGSQQFEVVSFTSEGEGTPTTEHRITVR